VSGTHPELSILVPVYQAAPLVQPLADALVAALDGHGAWEAWLIDDASDDDSWTAITQVAARHANIHGLRLAANRGQHWATLVGLRQARGTWVAAIDCDLQYDPADLLRLRTAANERVPLAIGERLKRPDPGWRQMASRIFHGLLMPHPPDGQVDFTNLWLARTCLLQPLLRAPRAYVYLPVELARLPVPRASVPVVQRRRPAGRSSYTPMRLVRFAWFIWWNYVPGRMAALTVTAAAGGATLTATLVHAAAPGIAVFAGAGTAGILTAAWRGLRSRQPRDFPRVAADTADTPNAAAN